MQSEIKFQDTVHMECISGNRDDPSRVLTQHIHRVKKRKKVVHILGLNFRAAAALKRWKTEDRSFRSNNLSGQLFFSIGVEYTKYII